MLSSALESKPRSLAITFSAISTRRPSRSTPRRSNPTIRPGPSNSIRNIPELKAKYWGTWQPYGNDYHKDVKAGGSDEGTKIKAKVATVAKSLAEFKAGYKKELGLA